MPWLCSYVQDHKNWNSIRKTQEELQKPLLYTCSTPKNSPPQMPTPVKFLVISSGGRNVCACICVYIHILLMSKRSYSIFSLLYWKCFPINILRSTSFFLITALHSTIWIHHNLISYWTLSLFLVYTVQTMLQWTFLYKHFL